MTRIDPSPRLSLTPEGTAGRLVVDLEAFFEFSFWMADELERLVAAHRPEHLPPVKVHGPNPPDDFAPLSGEMLN